MILLAASINDVLPELHIKDGRGEPYLIKCSGRTWIELCKQENADLSKTKMYGVRVSIDNAVPEGRYRIYFEGDV